MKHFIHLCMLSILTALSCCRGQSTSSPVSDPPVARDQQKEVGGACDGCDLMFEGMPSEINAIDTSAGWAETGQRLILSGRVYHADQKTPASDIIIYYWHTDNQGYYSAAEQNSFYAPHRHGHIRGWMKTDTGGNYKLYTIRPSPYPGASIPAHIHITIKEPDIANAYYIDEIVFDDDSLLTSEKRAKLENRGGSGIVQLRTAGSVHEANHDIVLGLNIPNYPAR